MSTGVDSGRRTGIWSYIPFPSNPRRRSASLPYRANGSPSDPFDPFEKPDRHSSIGVGSRSSSETLSMSLKSAWMSQGQRGRYLKTGVVALFVISIFLYLSGGNFRSTNPSPTSNSPTSRCTRPHDASRPLIQYALMIDAGSTGSRIHVYRFNNCGPTPELEDEKFKMTEKREGGSGLSSYKSDAEGAARSLDILMDEAVSSVPDEYKSCSPVAVKATAGLRLLGDEMSGKILDAVRERLETKYPFPVVSRQKDGVVIMKGEDEGVYAWITTNYLLGKIGGPDKTPTAAILDLGGGSTQIVFQPTFKESTRGGLPEKLADGDHKYDLKFGGRDFSLYQHSHLGYGLMSARNALHASLVDNMHRSNPGSTTTWLSAPIPNPCIAPGMSKSVQVTLPKDHELGPSVQVTMQGPPAATDALPAQCRALAEGILQKDAACNLSPCSFNGIHQPSLDKTFSREDVYVFSYFYDRIRPLGMPESFTLRELHDLTAQVCAGEESWNHSFRGLQGEEANSESVIDDLKGRPDWCLDLNFMYALLHTGYEMPIDREVKMAKKIKGNELGWCLGASLPLLEKESGWQCRVDRVS